MKTGILILFIVLSQNVFSQSKGNCYVSFSEMARVEKYDAAFVLFNIWIASESNLDSLQRVFIADDLVSIRKTAYWNFIEDSLKSRFFRIYPSIKLKDIGFELWKLGAEDQKYRELSQHYKKEEPEFNSPNYQEYIIEAIEETNFREERVYNYIKEYGWLGYDLVGKHGETSCFFIIQHGNKYRRKCLPLLKKSVDESQSSAYHYAMMYDKFLIKKKGKQLYGTQLKGEGPALFEIKDEINVNKRRKEFDLIPLEEELMNKWGIEYIPIQ